MVKLQIPVSFLDLALINKDSNTFETLQKVEEIAQALDKLDYKRLWFAEHHNSAHIASSATIVLMTHFAGKTQKIRIGSGGIMLPNHSPLVVAEQIGTLSSLYRDRIDLGLGRAPGTDQLTAQALNRDFYYAAQRFPEQVRQLQQYFSTDNAHSKVRAFPGEGINVPIWILGSSMDSAGLSSEMGLPYSFASHFAPTLMYQAFAYYKSHFRPSEYLDKPTTMACVNVIVADTQKEAELQANSMYKMFLNIVRGTREPISPPLETLDSIWDAREEAYVRNMLSHSFVGTPDSVHQQLLDFQKKINVEELMITTPVYSHSIRLKTIRYVREMFC
ncbi:MAG: LLM class flavin-dependent oxidoreductase [Chitinophagales bacterium]|nr:LLM class flavin-dependent oxidoreductase [Chitinophagales bacterium]